MSDTIIKVEGLGKKYLIGHEKQERYTALRDVMVNNLKGWGRGVKQMFQKGNDAMVTGDEIEEFWALKDVSFEIKRGDAVGIIGRNGAGKSTLLKLLSRITEPTTGKIEMRGRVASLLEVGTGFHPELTGRENIYLNGAILGMSRHEIKKKFDEIVDFSGVEKFLDTPVKRYSSGMYVRLAFAVAAHLEPEILVVDEVLAVGDAEFQKKCLGKMNDVSQNEGRTVLFVSHNMAAVEKLCTKGMLLQNGTNMLFTDTTSVLNYYFKQLKTSISTGTLKSKHIDIDVRMLNSDGKIITEVKCGERFSFELTLNPHTKLDKLDITIVVLNLHGQRILTFDTRYQTLNKIFISNKSVCLMMCNSNILVHGTYEIQIGLYVDSIYLTSWENVFQLIVLENDYYSTGRLPDLGQGHILTDASWTIEYQKR